MLFIHKDKNDIKNSWNAKWTKKGRLKTILNHCMLNFELIIDSWFEKFNSIFCQFLIRFFYCHVYNLDKCLPFTQKVHCLFVSCNIPLILQLSVFYWKIIHRTLKFIHFRYTFFVIKLYFDFILFHYFLIQLYHLRFIFLDKCR